MKEYLHQVRGLRRVDDPSMLLDPGVHNSSMHAAYQSMNTNLKQRQQLLLSHMPIMSRPFQERTCVHLNEANMTLNQEDQSGQAMRRELNTSINNVRMLNYDCLI